MEYLLGGSTGLLKEVDTRNRSLLRLLPLEDQSLERNVTQLCWSGGFGGYSEDEVTVGYRDGHIRSFNYLTMRLLRERRLDSRCVYLAMLNFHFDLFGPALYRERSDSPLYPPLDRPSVFGSNDRLLLAVSESGHVYVFDWSAPETGAAGADDGPAKHADALFVYKHKGPVTAAAVHPLMRNRLVLAGPNNPPALFDVFSQRVLWTGKFPHETVLGLPSSLETSALCFLEELDDDVVCVATRDSLVFVYHMAAQRDPVFEFNVCDYRSVGLSKRLLTLPHEDFNTRHRRTLSRAVNEKYSQSDRAILKLAKPPPYKLHFAGDSQDDSDDAFDPAAPGVSKIREGLFLRRHSPEKRDFCDLFLADNFGTIYRLQFLTGDLLLQWIYRKVQPTVAADAPGGLRGDLAPEAVGALPEGEKRKIAEYLLEARKRLCSSSSNDRRPHFRRNHHAQFVCRVLGCFNCHTGSVADLACTGDYLVSAGLDRFSNVVSVRTGRLLFRLYCSQKQTRVLVKNRCLLARFDDRTEFKPLKAPEAPEPVADAASSPSGSESGDSDPDEELEDWSEGEEEGEALSEASDTEPCDSDYNPDPGSDSG